MCKSRRADQIYSLNMCVCVFEYACVYLYDASWRSMYGFHLPPDVTMKTYGAAFISNYDEVQKVKAFPGSILL